MTIDSTHDKLLLEVCIGSLDDAHSAEQAGADRLELCGALELGGLTPSIGLVEQVCRQASLPVVVMLRPRAGGFAYSNHEFDCMLTDAEKVLAAGAEGIVFGLLDANRAIDVERTKQLVALAGDRQTVVHRAFDFVANKREALEQLIEIGVTRVLTSGGPATAIAGAESLRALQSQAAGRIELLPAGGITAAIASQLIAETGCGQLHIGASIGKYDPSTTREAAASLCDLQRLADGVYRTVSGEKVAAVVDDSL